MVISNDFILFSLTWNLTLSSIAVSCSMKRVSCKVKVLMTDRGAATGDILPSKQPPRSFQTLKVSCDWDWSWKCHVLGIAGFYIYIKFYTLHCIILWPNYRRILLFPAVFELVKLSDNCCGYRLRDISVRMFPWLQYIGRALELVLTDYMPCVVM